MKGDAALLNPDGGDSPSANRAVHDGVIGRQPLPFAERQTIVEIGLESVSNVKAGAPSLCPWIAIVKQRREVALRAVGVVNHLAVGIAALENQVLAEAALDLNDSSVETGTREILNQVAAANEVVRDELVGNCLFDAENGAAGLKRVW